MGKRGPRSGVGAEAASVGPLRAWAQGAAAALLLAVLTGALVTDTGSQLGCGHSWPLCRGQLLPAPSVQAWVEDGHRAVAAAAGLLTAAVAIWAWRRAGSAPGVRCCAVVGAGFVVLQGLLGAAAVLWPQSPGVLALHFGFSLMSFAAVVVLAALLRHPPAPRRAPARPMAAPLAPWAWLTLAWVYGVIYLGALVAHTHAALACPRWPLCGQPLVPPLQGAQGVQEAHRLAAGTAVLLVLSLYLQARRGEGRYRPAARGAAYALGLIGLQALSGGAMILTHAAVAAVLLHQALASLLFAALAYTALQTTALGSLSALCPTPSTLNPVPQRRG